MKKNFHQSLIFILSLFHVLQLIAEVEEVTITWNGFKCQSVCVGEIKQNFAKIKEVENLKVDPSGFATMRWNSQSTFSYEPFRYAAGAVGIYIRMMKVRVKGKISQQGENLYLVSDKDQARFFLIGPLKIEQGRYSPSNIDTHPLTASMREQFIEAAKRNQTLVIEGPLLLPSYYPLALIVEKMSVK